jgi:hypothetical protein
MTSSTLTPMQPTVEEFGHWLQTPGYRKPLATVLHHTEEPTAGGFSGRQTIVGIRNYHMNSRGASDIMANGYACPDGTIITGRPLSYANWAHANISLKHPEAEAQAISGGDHLWMNRNAFGLETVANFDREEPTGDGPAAHSFEVAMKTLVVVHRIFGIPAEHLFFHRDVADKSCPGMKLSRSDVRSELARRLRLAQVVKVVIGTDAVACQPAMVGEEMTVLADPFLAALGIATEAVPPGIVHANGRAYVHELAPCCAGWSMPFRMTEGGPRLYPQRC